MPGTLSDNILVRLVQAQAQSMDDTLKSWQVPTGKPLSEAGLSRFVQIGIRLYEDVESAYREGYTRSVKDASSTVEELQQERRVLSEIIHLGGQAVARMAECLDRIARTTNRTIEGSERLQQTAEQFEQLKVRLAEEWPVCSPEEEGEARQSGKQNEAQELNEAFAELAGVDRAAWLERVAEHKRRKPQGGQE